jgi:alpha-D-ribose 1-methylphosphonate 5-triphosphate synthase subunit PhnI
MSNECEREECQRIARTASAVYCDITGGLLSYPTYDTRTILAHANDEIQKLVDDALAEQRRDIAKDMREQFREHWFPMTSHTPGDVIEWFAERIESGRVA